MVKQKAKAKPKKPSVPRKPKVKKPKVEKVQELKPPKKKDVVDKLYRERLLRAKGSLGPRSTIFGPKDRQPVLDDKRFDEKLDYLYRMLLLGSQKPQRRVAMDISESEPHMMSDVATREPVQFPQPTRTQTREVERKQRVERKSAARSREQKSDPPKYSTSQTQTSTSPPEANEITRNLIPTISEAVLDANGEEMRQRFLLNLPRAQSPPIVQPAPMSLSLLSPDQPVPVSISPSEEQKEQEAISAQFRELAEQLENREPAAPPRRIRNIRVIRDPDNLIELLSGRKTKMSKVSHNPYEGEFNYTTPPHLPSTLVSKTTRSSKRTSRRVPSRDTAPQPTIVQPFHWSQMEENLSDFSTFSTYSRSPLISERTRSARQLSQRDRLFHPYHPKGNEIDSVGILDD
jgi:hypothetical protein